ncbi:MAG: thiolase family protein, partial [Actinobacteria bacterium]
MADNVWLIGAAMTKFGRYPDQDVVDLASDAALDAMADAGATIHDMNVMAVGSQFEMFTLGQRVQKQIGQTGIACYNVSNACATGASAVRTVIMAIKAGEADMGLAIGAEQMGKAGLLGNAGQARDKKNVFEPDGRYGSVMPVEGVLGTGVMPGVFAQAGMAYAAENDGVGFEQFAKIAEKNHAHSSLNPLAQYQKVFSLEEIMGSPMQAYPNSLLMCCPTGDGAAAIVLVSEKKLKTLDPDVRKRAVKISASV